MTKPTCTKPNCSGSLKRRGLCTRHYLEALESGEIERKAAKPVLQGDGSCSVEGCPKTAQKGGMCNAHYIRKRRHGDAQAPLKKVAMYATEEEREAAHKASKRRDYERHKDAYKERTKRWREANPDYYEARRKEEYFAREDVRAASRERTKKWNEANPERKREYDKKFAAENPALMRAYKSRYRAAKLNACPKWLTDEDKARIVEIYAEARRLTELTGVPHEVDHIIPLQGRTVCGLHVPWNLRVLTKEENNRRPRIWRDDEA